MGKECRCQVAIVGDITHVSIEDLHEYRVLVWQQLPGVLPSYIRNRMSTLRKANPRWRVQRVPQWMILQGFNQVVAPVMGRPYVTSLPDFIIAGPPKAFVNAFRLGVPLPASRAFVKEGN